MEYERKTTPSFVSRTILKIKTIRNLELENYLIFLMKLFTVSLLEQQKEKNLFLKNFLNCFEKFRVKKFCLFKILKFHFFFFKSDVKKSKRIKKLNERKKMRKKKEKKKKSKKGKEIEKKVKKKEGKEKK